MPNSPTFQEFFNAATGHAPFPWQEALYDRFVSDREDNIPASCNLPTGLGKTSVVAIWLIALAERPEKMPRRLVYVVNRRTVVDQTTDEVLNLRDRLHEAKLFEPLRDLCANSLLDGEPPLAISTLRGQFADNREWSADPARPAVICGTVDMIGSRLLFSGYGVGFRAKPLHAGFLGQDVLLVHDEAHLEPAFQELISRIEREQEEREKTGNLPWPKLRVMALSATAREVKENGKDAKPFELTCQEQDPPEQLPDPPTKPVHCVWRRLKAKKQLRLHECEDEKNKLAEQVAKLALKHNDSGHAVLIYVRKVEDVTNVVKELTNKKNGNIPDDHVETLTGTMRGYERDRMADPRRSDASQVFARFLPPPKLDANESEQWKIDPIRGTVYLVCTSAGEVGVNLSADHLVCDLSTFDSMAQRFGRVNRFGDRDDTRINVVYPTSFEKKGTINELDQRRQKTLELLRQLNGDGSPKALGELNQDDRLAAFAPPPAILPVSDILFDSWALTTIRGKLPGRPPVAPYLHGISDWQPPQTQVAWREEVGVINGDLLDRYKPDDLLEDYALKPHELLRENSTRVYNHLKKLEAPHDTPVWIIAEGVSVAVTTLGEVIDAGKDDLGDKTILLPPAAGGLENGMMTSKSDVADDVADEWKNETDEKRRVRVWDDDPQFTAKTDGMRLIRPLIDTKPDADETEEEDNSGHRIWRWFELLTTGDSDGSKSSRKRVLWDVHTDDVVRNATNIVEKLPLSDEMKHAVIVASKAHDSGKRRDHFQRVLGNFDLQMLLAKSGKRSSRLPEQYRHEFGSLLDVQHDSEFQNLSDEMQEFVLHLIAAHHGRARPHFPQDEAFDPTANADDSASVATEVPRRFARLQRKYGRWGLAYLESLLRAADWAASANPSEFVETEPQERQ